MSPSNKTYDDAVSVSSSHTELKDVEEQSPEDRVRTQRRNSRDTVAMSVFFNTHDIDKSMQELFIEYDKDGDGSFSKEDVKHIITDLKAQFRANEKLAFSNLILKRMLMGGVIFFFLLVGSIFGLSFAVSSLTKDTSVNSSTGTLYTKDGAVVIATNSHAEVYETEAFAFGDCITTGAAEAIKADVVEGKNVMIQRNQEDGIHHQFEQISPSGAVFNDETGVACFPKTSGDGTNAVCFLSKAGRCDEPESRRRLKGPDCTNNSNAKKCRDAGLQGEPDGPTQVCTTCVLTEEKCNCLVIDYIDGTSAEECQICIVEDCSSCA